MNQLGAVRDSLAKLGSAADLGQLRDIYDSEGTRLGREGDLECRRLSVAGRDCEWQSSTEAGDATIYYLHGGGFTIGSLVSHRHLAGALAEAVGGRSFAIDYRLAPEYVMPAQIEDALAGYDHLLATGVASNQIAIAGDSAGGGLAMQLLLRLRETGRQMPACAALFSPWIDFEASGDSMTSKAALDPVISREVSLATVPLITGGIEPKSVGLAILDADLRGLPPLLLQVGSHEALLDDSTRLAVKAGHADVEVTLEIWPEMPHVWHFYHPVLTQGAEAVARAGAFIRRHCH